MEVNDEVEIGQEGSLDMDLETGHWSGKTLEVETEDRSP